MYASFFRKKPQPKLEHEKFILSDGDFVDIAWHKKKDSQTNTPIVILFHGLTGSYKSPYIRGMMQALAKNGYKTVLMHFRGCYKEINNLPRAYHSGETGDAKEFIASLQQRFPKAPLYAVGYSLGGNMLLKLLGELKEKTPFKAAISVSAPMQLHVAADVVSTGFSRLYQKQLMDSLKRSLVRKYEKHDMQSILNFKQENIKNLKTFWEYDGIYTAPIHGFSSAEDYYTKCSSRQFIKDIHTRTLIIHSSDDPFMDDRVLPSKVDVPLSVTLELSKYGGHVGFIEGSFFKPDYWLEKRALEFFNNAL